MNAAVFVEIDDLHRALRERCEVEASDARDAALQILQRLLARLRDEGDVMVLGRSYAAFDAWPGNEIAHDLALLGLDPQYVLVSHNGQNSADVQLTFDVARVLFRRDDIGLIVVVSGNRDFLPLARQVLEEGRDLRIVSFSDTTSGDLRERVGAARFWDAQTFVVGDALPDDGEPVVTDGRRAIRPIGSRDAARSGPLRGAAESAVVVGRIPVTWSGPTSDDEQEERVRLCLELMMRSRMRHGSREIWLSPFLKGPMSQHFAHVVHPDRRALINLLRDRGVIRIEERENQFAEHPYSVIVIDDEHPLAREVDARIRHA